MIDILHSIEADYYRTRLRNIAFVISINKNKQIQEKRNIAAQNIQGCQRHNLDHIFYSSSFSSTVHITHKHSEHAWLIQRFMPCSAGGADAIMVTPPFCLSTFSCQPKKEKTN